MQLTDYEASNLLWCLEHIMAQTVPSPFNTGDWVGHIRWKLDAAYVKHWATEGPNVPYGEIK